MNLEAINNVKNITTRDFDISKDKKTNDQGIRFQAEVLEQKAKLYSENILKKELIEAQQYILKNSNIKELSIVNIGNGDLKNESAGAVLGQIMATSSAIQAASK